MRFKVMFTVFLLTLTACVTAIPVEQTPRSTNPGYEPSGYTQFCLDFPKSLLCEEAT